MKSSLERRPRMLCRTAVLTVCLALSSVSALAATALEELLVSPDITITLAGVTLDDEDVVADDLNGSVTLISASPVPAAAALSAYVRFPDGDRLVSWDVTVKLGPLTIEPRDVARYDGSGHTLEFDGSGLGIPAGVSVDAVGVLEDGDLIVSFDVTVTVPGLTVDDEDLVRVNDFGFTPFFDGSVAGIDPGLDLDAAHYILSNGHLLLSFDGSGSVDGEDFDDEDVLEYDPVGGSWELIYDGSVVHQTSAWLSADLDALDAKIAAPEVIEVIPADNDIGILRGTNVYVIFSEPVDPLTVTGSTFTLKDESAISVPATVSLSPSGLQATLDPTLDLLTTHTYTVDVLGGPAGVKDLGGTPLIPFTSQFQTGTAPVTGVVQELIDFSLLGVVPASPLPVSGTNSPAQAGWSVASAGDLNLDGFNDFVVGQPGLDIERVVCVGGGSDEFEPCDLPGDCDSGMCELATIREAGAVIVYFGGDDPELPQLIFHGELPHERLGSALAAGFKFNNDDTPDLLLGAEQVNRSGVDDGGCDDGDPCGPGKVYMVYFDMSLGPDPITPPTLAIGEFAHVVFHGTASGDLRLEEVALAAGGPVSQGAAGPDIVIGAPHQTVGSNTEAGRVYLVFHDETLSGDVTLTPANVASIGRVYENDLGGAHHSFGASAAFTGDVTGGSGTDLAIGFPKWDAATPLNNEGAVYVIAGGALMTGTKNVSMLTTRITGTIVGEQLGFAVADGHDHLLDEQADLLVGAPFGSSFTGRVIHTSVSLSLSVSANQFGDGGTLAGRIWIGAEPGDQAGYRVAGVGDVTENNWDDIVIGAPLATPNSKSEAGIIHVVQGRSYVGAAVGSQDQELSNLGVTIAGLTLAGQEPGEHVGHAIAAGGRLDVNDSDDFVVGAPGGSGGLGKFYVVVDSIPDVLKNCGQNGCTVRHDDTGAQIVIPKNVLDSPADVSVVGFLAGEDVIPPELNEHLPNGGKVIAAGFSDYDEEGQEFNGTSAEDPILHVPIAASLQDQLEEPPTTEVIYEYGGFPLYWHTQGLTGMRDPNPQFPSEMAVKLETRELRVYAVFFFDEDLDGIRDEIDCADDDPTVWRVPGDIQNVRHLPDKATVEWDSNADYSGTVDDYEVLRGVVDEWPVGTGASEMIIATTSGTMIVDSSTPGSNTAYYYLVRGVNFCGIGTWGFQTDGCERTIPCP